MSIVNEREQFGQKFGLLSVHTVLFVVLPAFLNKDRYKSKLNSFMNSQGEQLF